MVKTRVSIKQLDYGLEISIAAIKIKSIANSLIV